MLAEAAEAAVAETRADHVSWFGGLEDEKS